MFRRGREAEKGGEKEEEEEEYPDDVEVECLHEYDEEDVYVVVELPPGMDAEALGTSTVTVKVSTRCRILPVLLHYLHYDFCAIFVQFVPNRSRSTWRIPVLWKNKLASSSYGQ